MRRYIGSIPLSRHHIVTSPRRYMKLSDARNTRRVRHPLYWSIAQSVERAAVNRWVVGSSPTGSATYLPLLGEIYKERSVYYN